jgi:hypothetical protein
MVSVIAIDTFDKYSYPMLNLNEFGAYAQFFIFPYWVGNAIMGQE